MKRLKIYIFGMCEATWNGARIDTFDDNKIIHS